MLTVFIYQYCGVGKVSSPFSLLYTPRTITDVHHRRRLQHLAVYPISRGQLINVVAFVTIPQGAEKHLTYPGKWVQEATIEEMKEAYSGWEPEVQALLDVRIHYCFVLCDISDHLAEV